MAGFFNRIDQEFGTTVKEDFKQYADINRKLSNMETRKEFLLKCRRAGLSPPHIQNSFKCISELLVEQSPHLRKLERDIARFKKSVLNTEVKHTFFKLRTYQQQFNGLRSKIQEVVPEGVSREFLGKQQVYSDRNKAKTEWKIEQKFQMLLNTPHQSFTTTEPTLNNKAILNATAVALPGEVEHLLSLGSKFALPHKNLSEVPIYHLIADVESVIRTNDDTAVQERTRCSVANQIQNYLHKAQHGGTNDPVTNFYRNAEQHTREFFKTHPEIIVVNSDKGNRTVVMEREQYTTMMKTLLEDDRTYLRLAKDPTSTFQNKNNTIVKRLQDLHLEPNLASKLKTYRAVCPKIYGQPKAHKPGLPLRPVVPCMTAPSYELSKYVGKILQNSLVSKYSIKDSFGFCEYVNSIELPEGHILVSFDVVALFTSIPKSLVKRSIFRHWDDIGKNTAICLDLFWEVTEFCIDCSYFVFEELTTDRHYVMDDLLDDAVASSVIAIPFLRKYVDDLFLVLPTDKVAEVQNVFNQQDQHIQFTVEKEENNRLPFLDMVLVRREDRTIRTE
ncbi:uncharacterized protein LOC135701953 [Ochlerotatus camptorhynchus]|uniref:uncharacterized protein LOC135701953 n=1 Tax=Ochlerotatus camptorhynchus TaxID=644619 RepID=UPI0031E3FF23